MLDFRGACFINGGQPGESASSGLKSVRVNSICTGPVVMLKPANASGVLGRADVGVAEASMQLLISTEILQPRQISRGKTTRADLAGFRMTKVGRCTNIRVPRTREALPYYESSFEARYAVVRRSPQLFRDRTPAIAMDGPSGLRRRMRRHACMWRNRRHHHRRLGNHNPAHEVRDLGHRKGEDCHDHCHQAN